MLVLLAFLSVASAAILKRDTAIPSLANQLPAQDNITSLAAALLSNSSRPFQKGNMMGLGFLEVAMKDIVDLPCNGTYKVPSIGIYNYTQCQILNASGDVQNNATWQIDLGPLYDWAPRKSGKPYLDLAPALNHWQNEDTQSYEFIVALQFYAEYHYYVARNLEEYFWSQNSTYANITNVNPNVAYNATYIYQVAKGSTIRFAHALLQESVLQILLDNPTGDRELGFNHATFDLWFRRDVASATGTASENGAVLPSVRVNQEFPNDITRKNQTHHLLSALDWTLSLQNPNISTRYSSNNDAPSCDGVSPRSELTYKVMNLLDTPIYRFGERIHPTFKKQTQLQLHRTRELRLGSYKNYLDALGISSTAADGACNVYSGAIKENNATRQYQMRIASAVMAAIVPISDAIMADPFSYFRNNTKMYWSAGLFHPNSALLGDDTCCLNYLGQPFHDTQHISGFTYCYAVNSECTVTAKNAGAALFGYHPDMSEADTPLYPFRSNGAFFSYPPDYPSLNPPDLNPLGFRQGFVWRTVAEFGNTLYYNFDGLNTLALKQQGTDTSYLPNPILDSIPTNIGWSDEAYDCTCNTKLALGSSCTRAAGNPIGEGMDCLWFGA